jgi:hypothetical protein
MPYTQALMDINTAFIPPEIQTARVIHNKGTKEPSLIFAGMSYVASITDKQNKKWALKLFRGRVDAQVVADLQARYTELQQFLASKKNKHFLETRYFNDGVCIDGKIFPVLLIEWAEGVLFDKAIQNSILQGDQKELNRLATKTAELAKTLADLGIAHGDIHFKNIIVAPNGELVLLDYDDIWIKDRVEINARVWGKPEFQHPLREKNTINGVGVDNFSFWITIASIFLIIADSNGWNILKQNGGTDDALLFSDKDFKKPDESLIFNHYIKSTNQVIQNWLAVILNDLIAVENLNEIPGTFKPQELYAKYANDNWKPNKFTLYNPRTREFVKKN